MQKKLDHEKLDVYQLELEFVAWATDLIAELSDSRDARKRRIAETIDHLDRASLSSLFNTSEGNGRRQMKGRAKFFDDARGSATECAACLDALVAKSACAAERVDHGKVLLVRIVSMLCKLVDKFSPRTGMIREEGCEYSVEDNEENDRDVRLEDEGGGRGTSTIGTRTIGTRTREEDEGGGR